jgi:hypothetical protein
MFVQMLGIHPVSFPLCASSSLSFMAATTFSASLFMLRYEPCN